MINISNNLPSKIAHDLSDRSGSENGSKAKTIEELKAQTGFRQTLLSYVEVVAQIERMHRLLLDVIKDEFARLNILEINSVQGLLLFNVGKTEVSASELRTRGYYQGSNVSYNLRKLVDYGYMHYERNNADRRAVRIRLTDEGLNVYEIIKELISNLYADILYKEQWSMSDCRQTRDQLLLLERHWGNQIRHIY